MMLDDREINDIAAELEGDPSLYLREIKRLRATIVAYQQCEDCESGDHSCKERGGDRQWVEFECACPKCPPPPTTGAV